jgi:hypothetical protein
VAPVGEAGETRHRGAGSTGGLRHPRWRGRRSLPRMSSPPPLLPPSSPPPVRGGVDGDETPRCLGLGLMEAQWRPTYSGGRRRTRGRHGCEGGRAAASRRCSTPARRRPVPPASPKVKGRRVTTATSPDVSAGPSWQRRRGGAR